MQQVKLLLMLSRCGDIKKASNEIVESLDITMERARGIEPPSLAWEADILPMNYARI